MEVEEAPPSTSTTTTPSGPTADDNEPMASPSAAAEEVEDEEDCGDLAELLERAESSTEDPTELLEQILTEPQDRYGPKACVVKERAVYALARAHCAADRHDEVVGLLTGSTCSGFFANATKAKCAKVVRGVLDAVCESSPDELEMQAEICRNIIAWADASKRTFLRQRVEARLASVLFQLRRYAPALSLVDGLLSELKRLDDKQLLVETHLVESRVHHGLRNVPKARSALTASRTAANAVYVAPALQSRIDSMSGVLHCEEGDYDTAHSYFLEAFEQLDQLDNRPRATEALKYMMLCKISDALGKALSTTTTNNNNNSSSFDLSNLVSARQAVKYAGREVEAMTAVAAAASERSLKSFEKALEDYGEELRNDVLVRNHLRALQTQLLESNLVRIIEPYSCVELEHVAKLIDMPVDAVEKKLGQMILDGKFNGILDQGQGRLDVYEDERDDPAMEKGLRVIDNMDKVVTSLFHRSEKLRTMMI